MESDEDYKIPIGGTGKFKVRCNPSGKQDALSVFLNELTALCRKHQIFIHGCGCCGSPLLYGEGVTGDADNLGYDEEKKFIRWILSFEISTVMLILEVIMIDHFWWDTRHDGGCVNAILKFSVEARMWYLKTDVKIRLKRFIVHHEDVQDVIHLWKRLQIVKKDFGEETGSMIIQQAIEEINNEFNDHDWSVVIYEKIAQAREKLNDDFVRMI